MCWNHVTLQDLFQNMNGCHRSQQEVIPIPWPHQLKCALAVPVAAEPPPYIDGIRINSPHYLTKIRLTNAGSHTFTLVVSQYEKQNTINYTLRVGGPAPSHALSLSKSRAASRHFLALLARKMIICHLRLGFWRWLGRKLFRAEGQLGRKWEKSPRGFAATSASPELSRGKVFLRSSLSGTAQSDRRSLDLLFQRSYLIRNGTKIVLAQCHLFCCRRVLFALVAFLIWFTDV